MSEIGDYIVFPDFYMYRTEGGWNWVSSDATISSRAAFDFAPQAMLDARHALNKREQKRTK